MFCSVNIFHRSSGPQTVNTSEMTSKRVFFTECVSCCCLMAQAQVEELEKKLTAVHTKGLENVENEEREQQQKEQKNTPAPRNASRSTRGVAKLAVAQNTFTPSVHRIFLWARLQQLVSTYLGTCRIF